MKLSLFYFVCIFKTLLSTVDPTGFDSQCPTSRRLLLFGGLNSPFGGKKSIHISSKSSSPPKYARSGASRGLVVFIRPQTSTELHHKPRSYTHLLKSKLYTKEERAKLKQFAKEKKKDQKLKKKNITQHKPSISTKTQELVTTNGADLDRCRTLLHVDQHSLTTTKDEKKKSKSTKEKKPNKTKPIQQEISSKVKNIKKKVAALPVESKKEKPTRSNSKLNEKRTTEIPSPPVNRPSATRPLTPPVNEIPIKTPPPPSSQSTTKTKSKREKPQKIIIIQETTEPFQRTEDGIDDKNNSVVGRAFYFVKNMFQLSDDILDENYTQEDQIIDITNGQQQHHHSRKLLTIDDDETSSINYNDVNDYEFDLDLNNEQSIETFAATSISKRQLLSVKKNKQSTSSKTNNTKDRKAKITRTNTDTAKPKVGWAYRYRISRYLDAQKMKRTGNKNKITEGGKTKHQEKRSNSKQKNKKTSSSSNSKISKRKLLEYDNNDDSSWDGDKTSDQDIVNSVKITQEYVPKRHLLASKIKDKHDTENNNDNEKEKDHSKTNQRRRIKSFEELTDPIAIVQSYDRGLYKPRVGWQFRYRVSRYIDSLRENIREDQQRLKLGLQAIKRKTPQELSGRRKRVLDKPFAPDPDELKKQEEATVGVQENKPNVGWRYRYRVSKMVEAKQRGDFIDDEEEKRKARLEQKKKPQSVTKSYDQEEHDLDPELYKINDEGRRVGWTYRYRIRRKLDDLKQKHAENGIPFDLETLGGKREKKVIEPAIKSSVKKTIETIAEKSEDKKKSVGWQYRYRVSKMREAQKQQASPIKKQDKISPKENLDPELARLKPEERIVGWKYRYRIRRKLDSIKNATGDNQSGKRVKKQPSSKRKDKEKIIKQVEESIEKILNIDDIDETPFMEYFRRTSSYVLFGLVPTAKKSLCLLPLTMTFSFCKEENNDQALNTKEKPKQSSPKKLRTKKEQRAKQFIRARPTKLGADDKATERLVDQRMKELYKQPSLPPLQTPTDAIREKTKKKQRIRTPKQRNSNEQTKHINEEDHPIKKMVGVQSKKKKNKKQFQIIGQEVKVKHTHTTTSTPVTTQTPPPKQETVQTTPPPRLRSISEIIQEQAATILSTKRSSSRTPEEIEDKINEANEIVQERKKLKAIPPPPPILIDSTTSGEEDNDSTASDSGSKANKESSNNNQQSQNAKQSVDDRSDV